MVLRRAASVCLAFLGVRRASEIAGLRIADIKVDEAGGLVEVKVRSQENDQFGAGQVARVVALPSWGGARPVRLVTGWLRFGAWLVRNRDRAGGLAASGDNSTLFVGLARARFGFSLAASGVSASWKKGFDGTGLSPRQGGARFYVARGMAREATQELGGWESPAVIEGVYTKARSKGVIPEMRSAVAKACAGLGVECFVRDLDHVVCAESSEFMAAEQGAEARVWRQRIGSVRDLLVPSGVLPVREDFWSLTGRRVKALNLPTHQMREVLSWGSSYRAELRRYRSEEPFKVARRRDRGLAARLAPEKGARSHQ